MTKLNKAPRPRMPEVERITSVEQLLPVAREMVTRKPSNMYEGLQVKKGQKVLIINDSTADQLVVEALSTAMKENGAHISTIMLEGFVGLKDSVDILDNMFSNNWYPKWVWDAANEADIVLLTAFLKEPHTPVPELPGNPFIENIEMTADLMVSDYETYPVEIRDTIDKVAWETLFNSTHVKWTDLEGTDITIDYTAEEWRKAVESSLRRHDTPYHPGHLMLPAPSQTMNGVLVTSSITFAGPVPRTEMVIEKGKVVKVKGGGKFGKRLRETFEKHANLTSKGCPGPGINWITTIGICTHPKARRSPFFDELEGSARVYAWTFGHRRSGIFHTSVGEGMVSPNYKVIRHMDTFFNSLATDKGTIVENGHLKALDDPRVRKVASKYGDPEELLTEIWVPAVSGVNAP